MRQVGKNKTFLQSVIHAKNGLIVALMQERNMRKHALAAVVVIVFAILSQCSVPEWLWLLHCIILVFMAEMLNTLIEIIVDVLTKGEYYQWAKTVKDMAAGVVLLSAIYAFIVACLVFIPKVLK